MGFVPVINAENAASFSKDISEDFLHSACQLLTLEEFNGLEKCSLCLPSALYTTSKCPDLLAFSIDKKQALIVELTVKQLFGKRTFQINFWGNKIYEELILGLKMRGLCTKVFAMEVGARGLLGK